MAHAMTKIYGAGFERLNSQVFFCSRPQSPPSSPSTLIVICAWLFAAPKHVQKYIKLYNDEIPHADILLIQPVVGDMVWNPDAGQFKTLSPAVEVLRAFLDSAVNPDLRFHIFSNAGSHAAVQLVEAYSKDYPSSEMPISTLILDSCPGSPSAVLAANAMILALPRNPVIKLIGVALIYAAIAVVALLDAFGISENVLSKTRRQLNNPELPFLTPMVKRTYLYSKGDAMVPWMDIMEHAKDAEETFGAVSPGTHPVRTVEFNDSGHVGHLTMDKERYRDAIFESKN